MALLFRNFHSLTQNHLLLGYKHIQNSNYILKHRPLINTPLINIYSYNQNSQSSHITYSSSPYKLYSPYFSNTTYPNPSIFLNGYIYKPSKIESHSFSTNKNPPKTPYKTEEETNTKPSHLKSSEDSNSSKQTIQDDPQTLHSTTPPLPQQFRVPSPSVLGWLAHYIWPDSFKERMRVILSVTCLALSKIVIIQAPIFLGYLVDFFSGNVTNALPYVLIAAYPIARIAGSAFGELRNALFASVSQTACRIIACNAFFKLHTMDIDFLQTNKSGEVTAVIKRGIKSISQMLNMMLFQVFPTILEFLLVLSVMFYKVGLPLVLVTSSTMIFYIIFTMFVTSKRIEMRKRMNLAEQTAGGLLQDSYTNAEVVRYFTSEMDELYRFEIEQKKFEFENIKVSESLALLNFGQQAIFNVGLAACLYLTALQVMAGITPVGSLVMISSLLFQLAIPLNLIGSTYREMRLNLVDLQKLHQLLMIKPCVHTPESPVPYRYMGGKISFSDVHFDYVDRPETYIFSSTGKDDEEVSYEGIFPTQKTSKLTITPVFKGVNFDIDGGKKLAIVGPSGSGKSSIIKLLFRLFDPQKGNIFIDDQNIKFMDLTQLRQIFAIVPQDVVLFNESLLFNLKYGSPNATLEEVQEAAKKVQLHDIIMGMPNGYSTVVGERGIKLSGGEKQRVGLARCVLRKPKILIFDEATSALDTATEQRILEALHAISKDKTVVVIAHRLSTIVDAHKILFIDDGQVIEQGTHTQLMGLLNGHYREHWSKIYPDEQNGQESMD